MPAATPLFADDLEESDIAGARDVRAAAQLARAADVQHAHLVAVFFAEQHHRAGLLRLVDRQHPRLRRRVLQDLGVDDRLDAANLVVGDRRIVGEVEARLVGIDERALLLHVRSQHLAQRLVHQVGGRVIAHRPRTRRLVDVRGNGVAHLELAGHDDADMPEHVRLDLLRVLDGEQREAHPAQRELAAVADLSPDSA